LYDFLLSSSDVSSFNLSFVFVLSSFVLVSSSIIQHRNILFLFLKANTAASNINIIKVAAKAGARAGASSGLMAASQSAARAGAAAGKMAGEQAGAKAGEAAAAAAAKSVFANTFKAALASYKINNLNFDVRLFGPNGEKIVRQFRHKNNTDVNTTGTTNRTNVGSNNNNHNHIVNIHLFGANGQSIFQRKTAPQESSLAAPANRNLPRNTNGISGNSNRPNSQNVQENEYGEFQKENKPDGTFGSSGQLLHKEEYVPIDKGHHPLQKDEGNRKYSQALEGKQEDDTNDPQFTAIPLTSSNPSSLSPNSRSSTPSKTTDSPSPGFDPLNQADSNSPNHLTKTTDPYGLPVFTTIITESGKNNNKNNPANYGGTQSTREGEVFVYYTKAGQDPDVIARKLVYEGGPASKSK
jgi:hypothetical protein